MTTTPALPRVLLVEDHQDTRAMYATFLQERFDLMLAADGEQALQAMRGRRPDLVITDLALPGIGGVELISLMRRDPALASVPVICLSGFGGEEHVGPAMEAGAARVLQKPCLPDTLAEVVVDLLP